MNNKSWNETWTNSKEFEVSDQQVVTREHHKRISHVRQDIIKEQHIKERRSPNESFTNTNDVFKIDDQKVEKNFTKNFNKQVKILQKSQTSEISKADEKQKLERNMDNQRGVSN